LALKLTEGEDPMNSKNCTKCKKSKSLDEFYNDNRRGKRKPQCKDCCDASKAAWRYQNISKDKTTNSVWRQKNADKIFNQNRTGKRRFVSGRQGAKQRGYTWDLTFEQWIDLVLGHSCHYCGGTLPEAGCGLDRKDNKIGYVISNVVTCCKECNDIKGKHLTYDEMVAVAKFLKQIRNQTEKS
jgi:5-methylcytosine-specific restriction endonuclease McrA